MRPLDSDTSQAEPVESDAVGRWRAMTIEIERRLAESGRDRSASRLLCASKRQASDAIRPLLGAGARLFGENRVQEAADKWPLLRRSFPDLRLHLIGPLQTNKVDEALALFDMIETLDRPKLATALADRRDRGAVLPDLLVQVNTGEEPQKSGVSPEAADDFLDFCRGSLTLPVVGLMCIPPAGHQASPHFALLARIAARNGLTELSMGMSGDYESALQLGSTQIRIGSTIFGVRD